MDTLQKKFGARIKEIRKSKKLTQENLAEIVGMDIPNLSNIERGKKFVSAQTLSKIAKALSVSEKDLFDFEHLKNKQTLVENIIFLIKNSELSELEYIYKTIVNLKQFESKI